MFSTAAKNAMLDAQGITHVSLHSAYSTSGANELSGGSPAYARKTITLAAASAESKAASTQPVFDVPAATVRFIGKWTAITAGTFLGMIANGGSELDYTADLTANAILCPAHGLANGDKIVFIGGTPPTGLTEGTVYFVVSSATDNFQVAATSGGAAIDFTAHGQAKAKVSKIVEEVFGAQGTFTLTALTENLLG